MAMGKRILLTTTGSLGDLHPFMAFGLELRARGHEVTLATSNFYRPKIEQAGLKFAPMGPHFELGDVEMMRRVMDEKRGPEFLIRRLMYPSIPASYHEVMQALSHADLIVTHPITFGAQIAAEKTGAPWVSTVTTPMLFYSRFDPPAIPQYPFLSKLQALGPGVNGLLLRFGRLTTWPWFAPVRQFRKSVGLPPGRDPCFEGQHSPHRVLALFSRVLAEPQPDWPAQTRLTGFAFYDQAEHGRGLAPELERFLDAGPPPVVFTLGSSAVFQPGDFYRESLAAIRGLGCRAVLLAGNNELHEPLPPGVAAFPYAPFPKYFRAPQRWFTREVREPVGRPWPQEDRCSSCPSPSTSRTTPHACGAGAWRDRYREANSLPGVRLRSWGDCCPMRAMLAARRSWVRKCGPKMARARRQRPLPVFFN